MNILHLTYSYLPTLGGVQRSVHNLADELVRRGHHLLIATDGEQPLVYRRVTPAPVMQLRIPYPFHERMRARLWARTLDRLNLAVLAALCRRRRIEVVHCHLVNVDTRYAIWLKRRVGIKVVITVRGGEFHHWIANHTVRREYVRQMLESADAITALSQSQLDDARMLASGLPPEHAVIRNPADPQAIARHASRSVEFGCSAPYILFSGRLEQQKRIDWLIAAYHSIIAEAQDCPCDLVIAGAGSLLSELRRQGAGGPGAARIHFPGAFGYEDSLALIRDATVLVLPSQESEGCPNVILEAMALATPVIVSDHPPLLELVTHEVNGETFARGDVPALKNRLQSILAEPEKRSRYAAAALRHLKEQHRFDQIADAYEALYRRLCESNRESVDAPGKLRARSDITPKSPQTRTNDPE